MSWIFSHNEDDSVRYTLGKPGTNNLICIGINPSTAVPDNLDNTVTRVSRIAAKNGYDGWMMLNVYPQRDTFPVNIHDRAERSIIESNVAEIKKVLTQYKFTDIWAAWGVEITRRPFLLHCLKEVHDCFDHNYRWLHYGELTKAGHPKHPSRLPYSYQLQEFDIKSYLSALCQ